MALPRGESPLWLRAGLTGPATRSGNSSSLLSRMQEHGSCVRRARSLAAATPANLEYSRVSTECRIHGRTAGAVEFASQRSRGALPARGEYKTVTRSRFRDGARNTRVRAVRRRRVLAGRGIGHPRGLRRISTKRSLRRRTQGLRQRHWLRRLGDVPTVNDPGFVFAGDSARGASAPVRWVRKSTYR